MKNHRFHILFICLISIVVTSMTCDSKETILQTKKLINDKRFDEAKHLLQQELDPRENAPRYVNEAIVLAEIYYMENQLEQALQIIESVDLSLVSSIEKRNEAKLIQAIILSRSLLQSDMESAFTIIGSFIKNEIEHSPNLSSLLRCAQGLYDFRQGQIDAAHSHLLKIFADRSQGFALFCAGEILAQINILKGNTVQALNVLQIIHDLNIPDTTRNRIDGLLKISSRMYFDSKSKWINDLSFNTLTSSLQNPRDLAISDNHLFVIDDNGHVVKILGDELQFFTQPSHTQIDHFPCQPITVTNEKIIMSRGSLPMMPHESVKKPFCVLWTSPGVFWVLDNGLHRIIAFSKDGELLSINDDIPITGAERMAVDPSGGCWMLHPQRQRIYHFDSEGNQNIEKGFVGPGYLFREPIDIATDPIGHLYILDKSEKKIVVLMPSFVKLSELDLESLIPILRSPGALEISNNEIYVLDTRNDSVFKIY